MEDRECNHQNVVEHDELVCGDCGLVLGPIFRHERQAPPTPLPASSAHLTKKYSKYDTGGAAARQEEVLRDTISNALSRLFLDSDAMIEEAVSTWKMLSSYRNINSSRGRRHLAFILWKTLMDKGVIREKADLEAVLCEEKTSSSSGGSGRKLAGSVVFQPASARVETMGSWLGLPFRYRQVVKRYMRTFDFENHYLTKNPEVLAAASILFVCDKLRQRKQEKKGEGGALGASHDYNPPEYMKNVNADYISQELLHLEPNSGELKNGYSFLADQEQKRQARNKH